MLERPDELDDALEGRTPPAATDVRLLTETAAELRHALASWRLSVSDRARIDARVSALMTFAQQPVWRRLARRPHAPAYIGGAAAVAIAAAAAIAMAVARGRRHQHALAA